MYNFIMKLFLLLILLMFFLCIFPQFYISNEDLSVIHPGDNLYIYNTSGISGFTINYPENIMSVKKINNYSNKIYIGTLKKDINPGYIANFIFNTNSQSFDLPIKICPYFLDFSLNKHHYTINDTLKGQIIFANNNVTTSNGIDSIKTIIHSNKDTIIYTVFSDDSIYDYDYSTGIFKFVYNINLSPNTYSIDILYFSNNLQERINDVSGFYIGILNNEYDNIIVIDSKNQDFMHFASNNYILDNTFYHYTYYYGDSIDFDKYKTVIYINDNTENLLENINLYEKINNTSNTVFFFFDNFTNIIKSYKDSILYKLNINLKKENMEYDSTLLFSAYGNIDYIYDNNSNKNRNYIFRNNKFYIFYLPSQLNIDYIKDIYNTFHYKQLKFILKDFISIYTIESISDDIYEIEIYSITGEYYTINLDYIDYANYTININDLLYLINNKAKGIFFYKLKRGNQCISKGRLLQF